jgi:hypothetical protein
MQLYKRSNAMLFKQIYVEWYEIGMKKRKMKSKRKYSNKKAMSYHREGHYFHLASIGPDPPCPF